MAAEEGKDKKSSTKPISDQERFKYIGFEVFPGKPKDLFKTDAEREKYVGSVLAKREKGDTLRDQCTLLEERVSMTDRLVLTVASLIILLTLFIPWYSAYNEIVEETAAAPTAEQSAVVTDSATLASAAGDTLMASSAELEEAGEPAIVEATEATDPAAVAGTDETVAEREGVGVIKEGQAEEVLHGYVAKKKIHKEYERLSGIGALIALGSVGSYVFSSGFALAVTAILFILYTLVCIGAPIYTLYGLYGLKGDADQRALKLKKMLRINWIAPILFFVAMVFSFLGTEYGFDAASMYTSLGTGYGPDVFLGALSWGILVSLGTFILVAVKGVEI